jgi:HTH-type transcriptional regulator/antitoxin HigA
MQTLDIDNIVLKPIRNEKDYTEAKEVIELLIDCDLNEDAEKREKALDILEAITVLAIAFEKKTNPIERLDPIEAIKQRLEMLNLPQKELSKFLGGENRVSEILNRKRQMTLKMAKSLHKHFGIPAEVLLS